MRSRLTGLLFRVLLLVVAVAASMAYLLGASPRAATMTIHGVVAGSYFVPPNGATPSRTTASYYRGARVCLDANKNARCDSGEANAVTDDPGRFPLTGSGPAALAAELPGTPTHAGRACCQTSVF